MDAKEYELMAAVEDRMWWYRALHAHALNALTGAGRLGSGPILDLGCGTGGLLRRLAGAAVGRFQVGLDMEPVAAAIARRKSGAAVAIGSANKIPFASGAFAAVVSLDVICHRSVDSRAALTEVRRCLAQEGMLVINLPAYRWLASAHDRRVHSARRYTKGEVASLIAGAGFTVVRVGYWNTFLFPLLVLKRKFLAGEDAASDVRDYPWLLERLFGWITAIERQLIAWGVPMPFGSSVFAVAVKHD
jgi:SAM-dependent methyltransferase